MKKYLLTNHFSLRTNNRIDTVGIDSGLKNKSFFNPPQTSNYQVEVFKQIVLRDLEGIVPKKH